MNELLTVEGKSSLPLIADVDRAEAAELSVRCTPTLPANLDLKQLHHAFEFVARLHLTAKDDGALADALAHLDSILPAFLWTIHYAQPTATSNAADFAPASVHPPPPCKNAADNPNAPASAAPDSTVESSTEPSAEPSAEPSTEHRAAQEAARTAYTTGRLVHKDEAALHSIALPLVSEKRVVGVLTGARRATESRAPNGGAWTDVEVAILESLAAPLAAWLGNRRQRAEAERLLLTDDLTGLRNSRFLRETLISEIKRARRYNSQVAVLFLDIDNFKSVNDEHGHLVGSHCLIEAAAAILGGVRNTDTVARYGGDEFVVVLPETSLELAEHVAERIRVAFANRIFTGGRRLNLHLTASFGVAAFPHHAQSPQQLIAAADAAMYRAKELRKNCVRMAEPRQQVTKL